MGVEVGVRVRVAVGILVGVRLGVRVKVGRGVLVGVDEAVGVNVASAQTGAESALLTGSLVRPYSSNILTCFTPGNCFSERVNGPARL